MRFARVEVMVHAVDAAVLQPPGLLGLKQAQAGADLQRIGGLDPRNDRRHGVEFRSVGPRPEMTMQ